MVPGHPECCFKTIRQIVEKIRMLVYQPERQNVACQDHDVTLGLSVFFSGILYFQEIPDAGRRQLDYHQIQGFRF